MSKPRDTQLNFPAGQCVVMVPMTERTRAAKADTVQNVKADPFHVRRPQNFSLEVRIPDWKVGRHVSDTKLWSEICPARLQHDVRHLRSTYQFDKQRDHAYAREVDVTSWNYSTVEADERGRAAQTRKDTRRAVSCNHSRALQRYTSPIARVQAINDSMRAAKQAARDSAQQLEQQWGPECAEALRHSAVLRALRGSHKPQRLKASKADKAAVEALPQSDSEPEAPLATAGSQLAAALSLANA